MLSLWNQHQKQILCDIHRISGDSVNLILSYCKMKALSTQKMHINWLSFWKMSKYKLFIIQSIINNAHYHPNSHHNICLYDCFLGFRSLWLYFSQPRSGVQPPHSQAFHITQNDAKHSAGLLWTSDQSDSETSTWQHKTLTTNKFPCPGAIRTHNLRRRTAVDLRIRPRGHWDRHTLQCITAITNCIHCEVFLRKNNHDILFA